jgi:hypothetical protein
LARSKKQHSNSTHKSTYLRDQITQENPLYYGCWESFWFTLSPYLQRFFDQPALHGNWVIQLKAA